MSFNDNSDILLGVQIGSAVTTKDLDVTSVGVKKAVYETLKSGMVVSLNNTGSLVAFDGKICYGILTEATEKRTYGIVYGDNDYTIAVSRKGERYALALDETIKTGDLLTVDSTGVFTTTTDASKAVAKALDISIKNNNGVAYVPVSFNFDAIKDLSVVSAPVKFDAIAPLDTTNLGIQPLIDPVVKLLNKANLKEDAKALEDLKQPADAPADLLKEEPTQIEEV